MVGNVTVTDNGDAENKIYRNVRLSGINNLHLVRSGAYATTIYYLREIKNTFGYPFTELRISCTKEWHNRMVRKKTAMDITRIAYKGNIAFNSSFLTSF